MGVCSIHCDVCELVLELSPTNLDDLNPGVSIVIEKQIEQIDSSNS